MSLNERTIFEIHLTNAGFIRRGPIDESSIEGLRESAEPEEFAP